MPWQTVVLWAPPIPTGEKNRSGHEGGVSDKQWPQCLSLETQRSTWLRQFLWCFRCFFPRDSGVVVVGDLTTLAYHPISSRVAMSKEGIYAHSLHHRLWQLPPEKQSMCRQGSNNCCDLCLSEQLYCDPHKSQQGRRTDYEEESLAKRVHISSPLGCSEPIDSDFSDNVEVRDVFWGKDWWLASKKTRCNWDDWKKSCGSSIKKHLHCVPRHSQQGKRTDLEEEDVQVEGVQCLVYLDDSEPHTCHPKSDKEDLLSYNGLGEYGILAADLMTCDSFDYCYNGYATSSKVDKSLRSFLLLE